MKRSEYVEYLRQRLLERSTELSRKIGMPKRLFEREVKRQLDDDIIDSYRICSHCGQEWLSKKEMDLLIDRWNDPEKILNEIPSGHE